MKNQLDPRVEKVRKAYAKEPWGKLLLKYGFEPYNTESSARTVARKAAEEIEKLRGALTQAKAHLEYIGYGDSWERECAREAKLEGTIDAALAE